MNKGKFIWNPNFILPEQGIFEFDFIYINK